AALAAQMLLLALLTASCGGDSTAAQTGAADDTAAATEAVTEETDILAYLPETDLGGWQMDILCHEDHLSGTATFTASEQNGEIINDEIFYRTQRIEDRYNMVYNVIAENAANNWYAVRDRLDTTVAAGEDIYDLVVFYTYAMQAAIITGGYFYNMNEVPYLDFENPWWHTEINDAYSIYGYLPCVLSDYSVNSYQYANLLVFNKTVAENYDITNLYDLVRDHKWTMDSFLEIVKSVTSDSNGDGKMDVNDTWGYATNFGYHALTWAYAIGELGVTMTDEGVSLGYQTEKFTDLAQWLYDLLYTSDLAFEIGWDLPCDISWDENRVLIQAIWLNDLEDFREYNSEYGLLPYPMYDESQEKYYTYDDCRHAAFAIPIISADTNISNTGLILEALSADSYHNLIPKYLDTVVTFKLSRDEDSLEMLDYIMDGRVYDIGYAIPDTKSYSWMISNNLKASKGVLTSTIEKNRKASTLYYEKLLESYKALSDLEW
ncbi:MAG: hypothetical protein IJ302_07815, partial [Clostridia bacterium]|nr:hypothetical protein [Clostridia bacterium]